MNQLRRTSTYPKVRVLLTPLCAASIAARSCERMRDVSRAHCIGLICLVVLGLVGTALGATEANLAVEGTVTLRPLKTNACKAGTYQGGMSDLACSDSGTFKGKPVPGKASYAWRWTSKNGATEEVGNLGLNLGNGLLYLRLKGAFKPIGKVTLDKGVARTTGKVSFLQGSFAYKRRTASGTYTLDLVRDAKTYRTLKLTLHAIVR